MKRLHVCRECGAYYIYNGDCDNVYYDLCQDCENETRSKIRAKYIMMKHEVEMEENK